MRYSLPFFPPEATEMLNKSETNVTPQSHPATNTRPFNSRHSFYPFSSVCAKDIYYRLFNPNSSHALILKEPRLNNLAPGLPVLCFSLRSSDQVAVIVSHPGPQLEMVVVLILLCSFSERHSGAPSVQEGGLCGGGGTMYFSLNFGCGCSHVLPPPPQRQRLLHTKRIVKKTRILNSELFGSEVVQKC